MLIILHQKTLIIGDIIWKQDIGVSLLNHERLADMGHKTDSFNEIITKVLDDYEEYQEIKDLIEADKEFENGEGIHFYSS